MRSFNEMPERDRIYDDLYFELCILQGCALGTCFAAEHRLDGLLDDMRTGLLKEFDKVMALYEKLGKSNYSQ